MNAPGQTVWSRAVKFWLESPRTERLVPAALRARGGLLEARIKLFALVCLVIALIAPLIAQPYFSIGRRDLTVMTLCFAGLSASGYFVARIARRIAPGVHVFCLGIWCSSSAGYFVLGGLDSPTGSFFSLLPAVAFFFIDARAGVAWLLICMMTIVGLPALESFRMIETVDIFSGQRAAISEVINSLALLVGVWTYVVTQQAVREWLEARARRQEEKLGAVLRSASDGVVILDGERVESSNRAAALLLGELGDAARVAALAPRWIERGGRTLSISATAVGGERGQTVLIARDETERQRAIDETARARDAALASSRAKSRFLANMSHELRTPLNAVIGYAEIILEEDEGDGFAHEAGAIRAAGRRLLGIVDDVLEVASINEGRAELRADSFPVGRIVDALDAALGRAVRERGNRWETRVAPSAAGVEVQSDARKLERALASLITNANKFTDRGSVELAAGYDAGRDEVEFAVRDTGCGIAPEALETIWEEFAMGDESETRRHGGAGLGLTVARGLVGLLGGRIAVDSRPNEGSTFRVTIPRLPAPQAPTFGSAPSDPGSEPAA